MYIYIYIYTYIITSYFIWYHLTFLISLCSFACFTYVASETQLHSSSTLIKRARGHDGRCQAFPLQTCSMRALCVLYHHFRVAVSSCFIVVQRLTDKGHSGHPPRYGTLEEGEGSRSPAAARGGQRHRQGMAFLAWSTSHHLRRLLSALP
jgi:hypothetical protein